VKAASGTNQFRRTFCTKRRIHGPELHALGVELDGLAWILRPALRVVEGFLLHVLLQVAQGVPSAPVDGLQHLEARRLSPRAASGSRASASRPGAEVASVGGVSSPRATSLAGDGLGALGGVACG
jgi:hypothetical protein